MDELFLRFCFLDDLFKLHFLYASIFTKINDEKKEKNQFFKIFWRVFLKLEDNILEIHKHSWLSITWILKKPNSIQSFVEDIPEILTVPF